MLIPNPNTTVFHHVTVFFAEFLVESYFLIFINISLIIAVEP
jgi:hypothetical protein